MAILSEAETEACDRNPIKDGLDGFLREFEPKFKSLSLSDFKAFLHSDEGKFAHNYSWIRLTGPQAQYVVLGLYGLLSMLPAASCLSSRHSSKPLRYDLAAHSASALLNIEATALLLERVINHSPDYDIWCAVYDLVTPQTPPLTPRVPVTSVTETPFQFSSGALHNTDEWQHYYDGKDDDGDLLMDVTEAGVRYVAPCYHHASVRIGGRDDDLRSCVRKDVDLLIGKKWRARKRHAGDALSKTDSSSSLHKRVASTNLGSDRSQKGSRSNIQGDPGNGNGPEDQP